MHSHTTPGSGAIPVVYGVDRRFAVALAASLSSAVDHLGDGQRLEAFVIDGGLGRWHRSRLVRSFEGRRCAITWLTPPHQRLRRLRVGGEITVAAYFRLLIPELLGPEIAKVIYLDADVIVHGDLGRLWSTPLGPHSILAVQDQGVRCISDPYGLSNYRSLGIPEGAKYFNSGVLVLDLEKWRRERIADSVVEYIRDHSEHIRFHDQDGLNAVLWSKWGWLDPRWNQMPQLLQVTRVEDSPFDPITHERTVRDPYITHFASADKPWRFGCRHPAREAFARALESTEYRTFHPSIWRDRWVDAVHFGRSRLRRALQKVTGR
jgi:lipopolysaccharide biosynthesis glycosyltransferase